VQNNTAIMFLWLELQCGNLINIEISDSGRPRHSPAVSVLPHMSWCAVSLNNSHETSAAGRHLLGTHFAAPAALHWSTQLGDRGGAGRATPWVRSAAGASSTAQGGSMVEPGRFLGGGRQPTEQL